MGGSDDAYGSSFLKALPAPDAVESDPNERLKALMSQLEKIGAGGPPHEFLGVEYDPSRPPLPWNDSYGAVKHAPEVDISLPRFAAATGQRSPIDSARAHASVKSMYGL